MFDIALLAAISILSISSLRKFRTEVILGSLKQRILISHSCKTYVYQNSYHYK